MLWLDRERQIKETESDDLAARATDLPIWPSGHRPPWWAHLELRQFLTISHRQMTMKDARAKAIELFGNDVPHISSIHRYWTRLDVALGPRKGA